MDASGDAADGAPENDARLSRDVEADVPGAFGGPGCEDLEMPDCALGTALACGADCCGCGDLYTCQGGNWIPWGACVNGQPVPDGTSR